MTRFLEPRWLARHVAEDGLQSTCFGSWWDARDWLLSTSRAAGLPPDRGEQIREMLAQLRLDESLSYQWGQSAFSLVQYTMEAV